MKIVGARRAEFPQHYDMTREKTQQQIRRAARGTVPGFLGMDEMAKLSAPAVGCCHHCNRKTWDAASIGSRCEMPQPNGSACGGIFQVYP